MVTDAHGEMFAKQIVQKNWNINSQIVAVVFVYDLANYEFCNRQEFGRIHERGAPNSINNSYFWMSFYLSHKSPDILHPWAIFTYELLVKPIQRMANRAAQSKCIWSALKKGNNDTEFLFYYYYHLLHTVCCMHIAMFP